MSTMTYAATPGFAERRHRLATTAAMVVLFWMAAALLVTTAHRMIEPVTPVGCVAAKACAIIAVAFVYIKLTARAATLEHAILTGVAWLLFGIVAEIVIATNLGHAWFQLLGSPARPALRDVLLFAWVAGPALFVHAHSQETPNR